MVVYSFGRVIYLGLLSTALLCVYSTGFLWLNASRVYPTGAPARFSPRENLAKTHTPYNSYNTSEKKHSSNWILVNTRRRGGGNTDGAAKSRWLQSADLFSCTRSVCIYYRIVPRNASEVKVRSQSHTVLLTCLLHPATGSPRGSVTRAGVPAWSLQQAGISMEDAMLKAILQMMCSTRYATSVLPQGQSPSSRRRPTSSRRASRWRTPRSKPCCRGYCKLEGSG